MHGYDNYPPNMDRGMEERLGLEEPIAVYEGDDPEEEHNETHVWQRNSYSLN